MAASTPVAKTIVPFSFDEPQQGGTIWRFQVDVCVHSWGSGCCIKFRGQSFAAIRVLGYRGRLPWEMFRWTAEMAAMFRCVTAKKFTAKIGEKLAYMDDDEVSIRWSKMGGNRTTW